MVLYEFPMSEWVVFNYIGVLSKDLHSLDTKIFTEWLLGNPKYEIEKNANVECYECMSEKTSTDYRSSIWIPVKKK